MTLTAVSDSLQALVMVVVKGPAWQGAWRSILEAIKGQQIADQEQLLCQAAYYTLALIKLRNYTAATAELLKLGDLDAVHLTKTADDGRSSQAFSCVDWACLSSQCSSNIVMRHCLGAPALRHCKQ